MRRPLTDEDLTERATIDGRIVFAMATFAALTLLVALLDRIGIPEVLVRLIGPRVHPRGPRHARHPATLDARIALLCGRPRSVPMPYVGLGAAALAAGLLLPFVPPGSNSVPGLAPGIGAALGLVVAALVTGPVPAQDRRVFARRPRRGAVSQCRPAPGLAVTVAAIGGLIGMAGYATAIAPVTEVLGVGRPAATAILAFVLVSDCRTRWPVGCRLVCQWRSGRAGRLFHAAAGAAAVPKGDMPFPLIENPAVWREAGLQILTWQSDAVTVGSIIAAVGAMVGVAALAPLLCAPITARDGAAAMRGGVLTVAWSILLTALVSAALLWGTVTFSRAMAGQRPERLPDGVYAASRAGIVEICGGFPSTPTAARIQCASSVDSTGRLPVSAIKPLGPLYLIGLSSAAGLGAAGTSLLAAGLLAIGLTVAAAGFLVCATALGHDLFYRVSDHGAQASRRLAVTRAILVGIVAVGAMLSGARDFDPKQLVGLALALSAAGIFPLVVLSLWRRALGPDAVVSLLTGLGSAEAILFGGAPTLQALAFAAAIGAVMGTAAGFVTSFLHGGDRTDSEAFVEAVFHRKGDVLAPDKGA